MLEKSKTEYRFQASDGIIFTFSPDEVEKVVPAKGPAIYPAADSLIQANKIINHSKGQSMLLAVTDSAHQYSQWCTVVPLELSISYFWETG